MLGSQMITKLHLGRYLWKPVTSLFNSIGYSIVPHGSLPPEFPVDFDAEVIDTIKAVRPFTMTRAERIFSLVRAVEYLERAGIAGEYVECGVWRGGSMMAMALTLQRLGTMHRELHLFDTFAGMTPPTEHDVDFRKLAASALLGDAERSTSHVWGVAPLDDVKTNVQRTGYPAGRVHYHEGRVEDTLPVEAPQQIALLRLDTDWYESTRHELVHLFPRLSPGGILIIDDYGHWSGAKKAVDEYLAAHAPNVYLSRIDYSARLLVKPVTSVSVGAAV